MDASALADAAADVTVILDGVLAFQIHCAMCPNGHIVRGDGLRPHDLWNVHLLSPSHGVTLLVVVDTCTWLVHMRKVADESGPVIAAALEELVSLWGARPGTLRGDTFGRGKFATPEVQAWCRNNAIYPIYL